MKGLYCCIFSFFLTFVLSTTSGQSDGDYQSRASGDWNSATTWQVYNSGWQNLEDISAGPFQGVTPTNASGIVTLTGGYTITIPQNFSLTVDQVLVSANGRLEVSGTLTVSNGSGNDLEFYNDGEDYGFLTVLNGGLLIVNDGASLLGTSNATTNFLAGSTYRHLYTTTEGSLPTATWDATSLVDIKGYTYNSNVLATGSGNWNQAFGNFTFDCPLGVNGVFNFAGFLVNVAGNLGVESTGAGRINLSTTQSPTINIGSDLSILGTSRVNFNSSGNCIVNIGRDFIFNSTNTTGSQTNTTGTTVINISRDFIMNAPGGLLNLAAGAGGGSGSINISRNFTLESGTISENSSGTGVGNINFTGSTAATFVNMGTFTQTINFSVASLKTLDLGTSSFQGSGSFTLNGAIKLGSLDSGGALQLGDTGGNIRVTGSRTFASNSTIVYSGSGPQYVGNGFPSGGDVNLTINNTATPPTNTVTLSDNLDIVALRVLTLTSGSIVIGTQTLTINGTVVGTGGLVGGSTSNLIIGGTGNFGTLTFTGSNELLNFTVNRTSSGLVTLGGDLTILGLFTQNAGNIAIANNTFSISGDFNRTGGALSVSNESTLIVDGSGALPTDVALSGTTLGTLTLNRASSSFTTSASLNISSLNLLSGLFDNGNNIGITSGGTITRHSEGSMANSPNNTTVPYNLVYDVGTTITAGPELTGSATALDNVTKQGTATLTLNKSITINGDLTLTNGTFDASTFGVALKGDLISNAGGNFENSALVFAGTTVIRGATPPNFNNFTVNASSSLNLGAGTTVHISGNITNNGAIVGSTSTVVFDGTTTLDGNGTFPLKGDFHNIQIASTGTFGPVCAACVYPTNRFRIDVSGDFTILPGGTFTEGQSRVRLVGTTPQTLTMDGENFFDLYVAGNGGVTLAEPLLVSQYLEITENSTLDTGPGNHSITIGEDFAINGTFVPNFGTVIFNGAAGQEVSRSSGTSLINFYNVSIAKTATTTFAFNTPVNIINSIAITQPSSGYSVNFGGTVDAPNVTLLSDPATGRTGHILHIPDGVSISGNVRIYRFMEPAPSGDKIFRYISSPINANPVSQLQDDFPVTGAFTGASTCPGFRAGARNMYYYSEAVAGTNENGYVGFPASNVTEAMVSGRGYAVQMCDGVSTITWDVSGSIRRAFTGTPVPLPVTYNDYGLPEHDGMNLVGNPFPAPLDWEANGWVKTNVTNTFWIRNNKETNIASYNGDLNIGTNGATQYIALGQAFWVQATASSPALTITEEVKQDAQPEFFRESPLLDLLRMVVSHEGVSDEIIIHFDERADEASNSFGDSRKFMTEFLNLYSFSADSARLAINSLSNLSCSGAVGIGLDNVQPGVYSFSFSGFDSFSDVSVTLVDNWKGISRALKGQEFYSFDITDDVNSFGSSRFQLIFTRGEGVRSVVAQVPEVCEDEESLMIINDPQAGVSYYAVNASGQIMSETVLAKSEAELKFGLSLGAGDHKVTLMASKEGCSTIPVATIQSVVFPKPTIRTSSTAVICGEGSALLQVTGSPETVQFNWYENAGDLTPVAVTNVGEWLSPALTSERQYFVSASNAFGCEGEKVSVDVQQQPSENLLLFVENGKLVTNASGTVQWFFNGNKIDEQSKTLDMTDAGEYSIMSTSGQCSATASIEISPDQLSEASRIVVSPNPTSDFVDVEMSSTASSVRISIISPVGQLVGSFDLHNTASQIFNGRISLRDREVGLYILRIEEGEKVTYKRLIRK